MTSAHKADGTGSKPRSRVPDTRHHDVASERGADRAAVMATMITTAKLNDVDPQAWLADVLARIADHTIHRLDELLAWNWAAERERRKVAA
jgi:transposase